MKKAVKKTLNKDTNTTLFLYINKPFLYINSKELKRTKKTTPQHTYCK